jgi:fatty-acyl-CoA synthase
MATASEARIAPTGGLSHVIGSGEPPLVDQTIPDFLKQTVERDPDHAAAVFCAAGERWSYGGLARRADRLAAALLALGLYKGDRIGIWSPNRPEWLIAQFATARIGLILVNINPAYRRHELDYALNKVEAKALITARRFKSSDYIAMLRDLAPELDTATPGRLRSKRLAHLTTVIQLGDTPVEGMFAFDEVMAKGGGGNRARLDAISAGLDPDDAINIQFTSGTTGAPKGATLTHRNIVNNGRFCAHAMALGRDDRLAIPVPFYHCFGMVLGNLAAVAAGSTMVFPGEAFDALECLTALASERCTAVHGVPTMFAAMIDHPRFAEFDLKTLRTGIMAGSPCPIELMKRVVSQMHAREITIAYGMTETSPVSFQSDTRDSLERRVATVGRIHPHVEVKIVDGDGKTVPVGDKGELLTRGYSVMKGYWNDPERSAEAIDANGWMHTGDLATIDAQGYCNIVGRVKDMLIRGGENVYPREVEEFLFTHPKVQSVQVFGVPDAKYGEEVAAWIIARPGETLSEDEVRQFCQGQIAHYKIPRYIRLVAELPMTVTGKPQKFIMRDKMMAELGLSEEKTA